MLQPQRLRRGLAGAGARPMTRSQARDPIGQAAEGCLPLCQQRIHAARQRIPKNPPSKIAQTDCAATGDKESHRSGASGAQATYRRAARWWDGRHAVPASPIGAATDGARRASFPTDATNVKRHARWPLRERGLFSLVSLDPVVPQWIWAKNVLGFFVDSLLKHLAGGAERALLSPAGHTTAPAGLTSAASSRIS